MKKRVRYLSLDDVKALLSRLRRLYPSDNIVIMSRGAIEASLSMAVYAGRGLTSFRARVAAKAAALLYYFIMNHPLVDGNKRLATGVVHMFLLKNGYDIDREVLVRMAIDVAAGKSSLNDIYRLMYRYIVRVGK